MAPPQNLHAGREAESGRGLQIVDALASRWGTAPTQLAGRSVWFELDIRDAEHLALAAQ